MADSTPSAGVDIEELLGLAATATGRRSLIHRALDAVLARSAGTGVALYRATGDGFKREAVRGSGSFPASLTCAAMEALPSRALAGGALVFGSPNDMAPAEDLYDLALTLLSHGLSLGSRLEEQRFAVNYRGVELEALYDVGLAIASTLNLDELSEEVMLRAVSLLDARRGALFLLEGSNYQLQRTIGGDAVTRVACEAPEIAAALAGGKAGALELLPGAQYLLGVPIEVEGKPRGLLVVGDKESRVGVGPFVESDRRTLLLFANQAGIALENASLHLQALEKERLERDLDLAAEIQRQLLPTDTPEIPGFELAGWSRPARHVGGDYYSFFHRPEGRMGLALGDVSGKGMPAALLVSTLHSALKILAAQQEIGPPLMKALNTHLCEATAPNQFVTLLLAELEPSTGFIQYLNGGHNPSILLRADSQVDLFAPDGLPVGMMPYAEYGLRQVTIEPGDLLCIYSDGITEAASPEDQEFEMEGLIDTLRRHHQAPLRELIQQIDESVDRFTCGGPQGDDQTVLLLRRLKGS